MVDMLSRDHQQRMVQLLIAPSSPPTSRCHSTVMYPDGLERRVRRARRVHRAPAAAEARRRALVSGTADAVFQNLYSIVRESPRHVVVLSGDHVYKMDYSKMLRFHLERKADATLATH